MGYFRTELIRVPDRMDVRWLEPIGPIQRLFFPSERLPTTICLIEHGGRRHLIDTGLPGGEAALVERLAERNIKVDHIYLTHHHETHTAGVAALRSAGSPKVWCHRTEAPYCEQTGVAIDATFGDDDTLAGFLQVIPAPGHTPGNVAFYWAEPQAMFAGDVVMGLGSAEQPLRLPGAWDTASAPQVAIDAERIGEFEITALLPAHGKQFAADGGRVLRKFLERLGSC